MAELRTGEMSDEMDSDMEETCPTCYKIFYSKTNMRRHLNTQHLKINRKMCSQCNKTYASDTALRYHLSQCHKDVCKYQCDSCDEEFLSYKAFTNHWRKKKQINIPKCNYCESTFLNRSNLKRHISEVHNVVNNINTMKTTVLSYPYACDKCNFRTMRKHYLSQHKGIVHDQEGIVNLSCMHCDKSFKFKQNLSRHIRQAHQSILVVESIIFDLLIDM